MQTFAIVVREPLTSLKLVPLTLSLPIKLDWTPSLLQSWLVY